MSAVVKKKFSVDISSGFSGRAPCVRNGGGSGRRRRQWHVDFRIRPSTGSSPLPPTVGILINFTSLHYGGMNLKSVTSPNLSKSIVTFSISSHKELVALTHLPRTTVQFPAPVPCRGNTITARHSHCLRPHQLSWHEVISKVVPSIPLVRWSILKPSMNTD